MSDHHQKYLKFFTGLSLVLHIQKLFTVAKVLRSHVCGHDTQLRSYGWAEEMSQQLTVLTALPEDPGSIPRAHTVAHISLANTCRAKEAGKCSPAVSPEGAVATQVGKWLPTSARESLTYCGI